MNDLRKKKALLIKQAKNPFETGLSVFSDLGPWTFTNWKTNFPKMKYGKTFVLSTAPVPDNLNPKHVYTFADTKGISIYSQASKVQQKAAVTFIKWVFSKPEHDLALLKTTSLPPARDDLSTNSTFKAYFDKNPEMKPYAKEIPYAVPPMDNPNYNQLQTFIGQKAFNPVVKGTIAPKQGWDAMKKAIKGALK